MENITIVKVEDEVEIIEKLSSYIEEISQDAINNRQKFFIGLSALVAQVPVPLEDSSVFVMPLALQTSIGDGGSLVKFLVEALPKVKTDWSKWVLAFCDERVVPVDSEDSTFGTYKRELPPKVALQEDQFIVIKQGVPAEQVAQNYQQQLLDAFGTRDIKFDLLLLGLGPDGHTCSLFPGSLLPKYANLTVAPVTDSPKPPSSRITLTYEVLNNARNCIFAVSGSAKADTIKRILIKKEDLPATRVNPPDGKVYWIVDKAAGVHL